LAIQNGAKIENPNIEIRNPKQYQNPNLQNSKQSQGKTVVVVFWSLVFCSFRFASSFDIRISDFRVSAKWVKWQPQDHDFTLPK